MVPKDAGEERAVLVLDESDGARGLRPTEQAERHLRIQAGVETTRYRQDADAVPVTHQIEDGPHGIDLHDLARLDAMPAHQVIDQHAGVRIDRALEEDRTIED